MTLILYMIHQARKSAAATVFLFFVFVSLALIDSFVFAQQQTVVQTPFQQTNNSFYENTGVGWNYSNDNFFVNVPNGVRPPFGLGNPNADAQLGFGFNGPNGGQGSLNFTFGQGSTTTNSTTTPMLTLPNGGTGSIFNGSFRPFVTSFIPVVGGGGFGPQSYLGPVYNGGPIYTTNVGRGVSYPSVAPPAYSPLKQKLERMAIEGRLGTLGQSPSPSRPATRVATVPRKSVPSSAERGDISVAEIRRQQAANEAVAGSPFEEAAKKAADFESDGKLFSARQQFKKAARLAPASRRSEFRQSVERVTRLIEAKKSPK